ncbi:quinol:cytochrome C oxidoreductase [Taibaiella soli]|uniref:Quinol:cytochrome C oxidoreductase n=1 Tax=Taibaiella soli TaxID=1649169 RepID=A0A2W2AZH2_9BACT|nr:quinol:cytochrome C oxidoreductase [Taibaiella soli]PZF73078.1 quinol:cytochrome C oxidoreductase [Taibaiella soli]
MNERFEIPARLKTTSLVLMIIGLLVLGIGAFTLLNGAGATELSKTRFWIVLLHNSVFFLLMTVACVFIQAAASLAQGSWIVAYRRIPEAIGANVWIFGIITLVILFLIAYTFQVDGHNPIYHWATPHGDKILEGKHAFLSKGMFAGFTIVTIALWSFFGRKFRALSLAQESAPKNSTKIYWTTVKLSAIFLLVYALTQMSTTPWMWIMSIDAHWYSTMFSWYTFGSAFVSGMSLILLWVVYLKNQGNLELVNKEHVHDLGKWMFAFSIFWTYVWFCQYMLIWYSNIPEETTYFKIRQHGPYSMIWYSVFIINFIMPILILMSRPSKRNYFTVTFMAMTIIFGHWLDFYIMTMPGPMGANWHLGWYELGIFVGFVGVIMFTVSRTLASASLVPQNNVLLKEAVLHQS